MAGGGGAGGTAGGMGQQPGIMGGGQSPQPMSSQPRNAGFGPNVDNFGGPQMQQGMGQMGGMQIPPALQQAMQQRMMQGSLQPNNIPEYARPYVQQQQDPAQQMNNLNNMSNMLRGRPGMPGMMPNQIPDPSQIRPMPPRMMPNQIPNPSQVNSMPPRMMQEPPSPPPMQQPSGGITRLTRPNRLRGR